MRSIQTNLMIFMSDRLSVAFSFSRRAHLFTTCKAGGGILPDGRTVRSSRSVRRTLLQRGQAMSQANIACADGSLFCSVSKTMWRHIAAPSRRLPAKTCHWQIYLSYGCAE
ncbi:hypothetical protein [Holdemania massiliensis]|uniref:hypothetical protein n=1 Tax=Holdemania massiliensis TaxID=1468449 RepID=UPI0019D5558A|nr:hypothetical protein [Holdemania massiliensis]